MECGLLTTEFSSLSYKKGSTISKQYYSFSLKTSQSPIGDNLLLRRTVTLQITEAGLARYVLSCDDNHFYRIMEATANTAARPGTTTHYTTHMSDSYLRNYRSRKNSDPTEASSSPQRFLPDPCTCLTDYPHEFPIYLHEIITSLLDEDVANDYDIADLLERAQFDEVEDDEGNDNGSDDDDD